MQEHSLQTCERLISRLARGMGTHMMPVVVLLHPHPRDVDLGQPHLKLEARAEGGACTQFHSSHAGRLLEKPEQSICCHANTTRYLDFNLVRRRFNLLYIKWHLHRDLD